MMKTTISHPSTHPPHTHPKKKKKGKRKKERKEKKKEKNGNGNGNDNTIISIQEASPIIQHFFKLLETLVSQEGSYFSRN